MAVKSLVSKRLYRLISFLLVKISIYISIYISEDKTSALCSVGSKLIPRTITKTGSFFVEFIITTSNDF